MYGILVFQCAKTVGKLAVLKLVHPPRLRYTLEIQIGNFCWPNLVWTLTCCEESHVTKTLGFHKLLSEMFLREILLPPKKLTVKLFCPPIPDRTEFTSSVWPLSFLSCDNQPELCFLYYDQLFSKNISPKTSRIFLLTLLTCDRQFFQFLSSSCT